LKPYRKYKDSGIHWLGKCGTQLNLNTETTGNIYIPVPINDEVNKIVEFLDKKTKKTDELIKKIKIKIEKIKEYRKTLISNVVTGKFLIECKSCSER